MNRNVLIGIDGGGSFIRVVICDCDGNILSHIKWNGGAFILKNSHAQENMCNAVTYAMSEVGVRPENVISIGAGIAGFDRADDLNWVKSLINIEGLSCPIKFVNDAVIAHIGAFVFEKGIVAICGTGSIILGINEKGDRIRNYDLNHYAKAASRHLTQTVVNKVLLSEYDSSDMTLLNKLLKHFKVSNVTQLEQRFSDDSQIWNKTKDKLCGDFAKSITDMAVNGSHLAQVVCDQAASEVVNGIELVSSYFEEPIFDVALVGGVANSEYINKKICDFLLKKSFRVKNEVFLPEIGAVLLAMHSINIRFDERILSNLRESKK